jgi:two-component system chemotaxis sensor kinase CheA
MQVTRSITDLLLKSVDIMREMLRAVQHKTPIDAQRVADVQFDLELAIAQKSSPVAVAVATPAPIAPTVPTPARNAYRWRIHFRPYPQLFVHGNDPLRMLRELADLGDLSVVVAARNLPALRELDPESCYLAWDLTVDTDATREVIDQVFDWAEGDCELKIHDENAAAASAKSVPVAEMKAPEALRPAAVEAVEAPKHGLGDGSSIRVSTEKVDELMNTVGELVIAQSMLTQLGTKMTGGFADQLRAGLAQLERNVRELQESVMRVRMLPISFVFSRFPRMVRDLSQRLGKQVELKVIGDQTELDKTVLEKIGDPLVHLVRNSVDHGIEMPQARVAADKPSTGVISLEAYHKGGSIVVEVCDDGGGLQRDRILAKARERGLVGANEVLSDEQIFHLIFMPGFSTNDHATDISGRGVGMDVVRRNIKELGGSIEVSSTLGRGSRFVITLPLTLAIVDGQSVSVGSETYIVPLITIIESLQLRPGGVSRIAGQQEVFWFRDGYVPVVRLHEVFGVRSKATELHEGLIMVVEGDGRRVGLFVDDLLGQQQVVIKSLETNFRRVDGVSGATILGDGAVALILDVPGLIRAASLRVAARAAKELEAA